MMSPLELVALTESLNPARFLSVVHTLPVSTPACSLGQIKLGGLEV